MENLKEIIGNLNEIDDIQYDDKKNVLIITPYRGNVYEICLDYPTIESVEEIIVYKLTDGTYFDNRGRRVNFERIFEIT